MPDSQSTPYGYLILEVRGADGAVAAAHGDVASLRHPVRPVGLFLNAPEIFGLCCGRTAAVRQITLWTESGVCVSIGLRTGAAIPAGALPALMRRAAAAPGEDVASLPAESGLPEQASGSCAEPASESAGEALGRYMSSGELASFLALHIAARTPLPALTLLVEATAVTTAKGALLPALALPGDSGAEFDVVAPARPAEAARRAHPQPARPATAPKPRTLQDIEDELDGDNALRGLPAPPRRRRTSPWIWAALGVVALACGWAVVHFLPSLVPDTTPYDGMESADVSLLAHDPLYDTITITATDTVPAGVIPDTEAATDPLAATATADTPEQPPADEPQPPLEPAPEPQADLIAADRKYLNSNTVWRRSELHSDEAKALYDSFAAGDIEAIAAQPYFHTRGAATNRTALRVADMLWRAHGSDTEPHNQAILRRLKGEQSINLTRLLDDLAKKQSPKPNRKPRPVE